MSGAERQRGKIWGLVVAAIAEIPANIVALFATVGVAKYSGLFDGKAHVPLALAVLAAQIVVVAGLTWLVLYFSFIRGRAPRRGATYFLVLVLVGFISNGGLVGLIVYAAQHRAQFFKAQDAANVRVALLEATQAEAFVVHHRVGSLNFHSRQPGAAGRISLAAKMLVQGVAKANADYWQRMQQLQFPDFLTPDRVDADPSLETTLRKLDGVRAAILQREADTDAAIALYRKAMASADIDSNTKRAVLSRIDVEMAAESGLRTRETSLQLSSIDEWKKVILELREERGRWRVDGEIISFLDVSAEQTYRQHMRSLLAKRREISLLENQ